MTKTLIDGMKNAKRVSTMMLSAVLLITGVGTVSARGGDSQESSELRQSKTTITGTVVDRTGDPVIGANIIEKGVALNGTVTDAEGRFSLNVSPGATLTVSYVGYITQDIALGDQTQLQIILQEDLRALDEVVVIGYGTAKRQDFTGSVASVRLENSPLALAPNLNALEALKGNVAGLDIGATNSAGGQPSMQLRGQKSISGSNDPLIVVDGVIYMGSLNDINPNDIASYDVLKDATSAAAYGSRSANGVIIITTKKGRTGKPLVSFNASGSMERWQNRPKLMTPDQWIESVMARNNNTDLSWMKPQETENMNAGKSTDWFDVATRTGYIQDYQIAVSGASDRANYYLSASYAKNRGIVFGDDYDRASVLAKISTDITDWLQIGVDGAYSRVDYSGAGADLYQAYIMSPYGVVYRDEENKLLEKYPYTQSGINPLWGTSEENRKNIDVRNNFRVNAFAVVKIPWIEGLSYRFNYAGNLSKNQSGDFYYERNYVKEGAYDDPTRYSPATYQSLLSSANGAINNNSTISWLIDNILTYKNTFGKHAVDVTAVATRDQRSWEQIISRGSDYAANGNTTLGIYGLHKATTQKVEISKDQRSNVGYFARAVYGFNNRYFLNASYRRDGASVFGADNKWGDFAAAGLAWKVTEESFMKSQQLLNSLKLKLSYGKNGNQGLGPYGTLSTVNNGSTGGVRYEFGNSNILYGITAGALGNASLGWESTSSWNTGFESAWLGNRIFLDADIYFSRTTDQIFDRNIPVMTGFKQMKSSMGEIGNTGVELTLRTVNIEKRDLTWTTGLTFWLNRNKLIHLYGDDVDGDGVEDDDIGSSRFIGKSLGAIYGWVQDGIVQEEDDAYIQMTGASPGAPKYRDLDLSESIGGEDREILGYDKPNFKLNMSNTLSYKNWDLYLMLTGTFGGGGYFMKSNARAYMASGTGVFNSNNIYVPWWTPENRSNVYPSATFSGDGRFLGLQSRTFVRLQDVTLSYTFREAWTRNLKIQNLKLFISGKNLFTITGWEGGDPEIGNGVHAGDYPVMTTLTVGANISF
ncbi:MAG: TonB-dependent receptor [Bacteroidales bacterium]|jgi:TonB-linked SusC/RagA family outer membrane protein|nr:TonB-dependent receptor [Bacteroidales bacterium]